MPLACNNLGAHTGRVNKLCIFAGATIFSYAFWALGEMLGGSFFVNFLLSGVGSIIGVYAGWKLAERLK